MSVAVAELRPPVLPAKPFVKWVGGKRRVLPHLLARLPRRFGRYHEPFVGGGALFFQLAQDRAGQGHWASLTDGNPRLVRTWRAIRDDVDAVLARLSEHEARHSREWYYRTRAVDIDAEGDDAVVAAWFVYLNRTGFNGLYRVNRSGRFNVPFGRYKDPLIRDEDNLRACSEALRGVELVCGDFAEAARRAERGDLVYFDPPYVPLSSTASFTAYTADGFGPTDQERLRDLALDLKDRGVHVALSNHDTPEIRRLYRERFTVRRVFVGRAINSAADKRGAVAELIIT